MSAATDENSALLPDPSPRDRGYTIVSVDDHLVELATQTGRSQMIRLPTRT